MDNLASELLKEIKNQSKRWFVAFIVCLVLLFVTNIAWFIVWTSPDESIEISSDEASNAIYSEEGGVKIER